MYFHDAQALAEHIVIATKGCSESGIPVDLTQYRMGMCIRYKKNDQRPAVTIHGRDSSLPSSEVFLMLRKIIMAAVASELSEMPKAIFCRSEKSEDILKKMVAATMPRTYTSIFRWFAFA